MSPPAEPSRVAVPESPDASRPPLPEQSARPGPAAFDSPDAGTMRRIAGLALPALVVLAAEPLYVLVDTAVVGHLGRLRHAAVAVGGPVISVAGWFGTQMA
jgi:Na+-driven multidrug efflux pump